MDSLEASSSEASHPSIGPGSLPTPGISLHPDLSLKLQTHLSAEPRPSLGLTEIQGLDRKHLGLWSA